MTIHRPTIKDLMDYAVLDDRGHTPDTRSWRAIVNRSEEIEFDHLLLALDDPSNDRKPQLALELGKVDDRAYAYDALRLLEVGGGGVGLVPYLVDPKAQELYVGTVVQYRFFLGSPEDGFIRGFIPRGVTPDEQVLNETAGEFGKSILTSGKPFRLLGEPLNPYSNMIDTRPRPKLAKPGNHLYGLRLAATVIDFNGDKPGFRENIFEPGDKLEALSRGHLMPWWQAAQGRDSVLATGVARLMLTLRERGELNLMFSS